MCYYVLDNSTRECCKGKAEYLKGYSLYKVEINQIQYTVPSTVHCTVHSTLYSTEYYRSNFLLLYYSY